MSSFLYAINIGTLAAWLSVAGFGMVGIVVPATLEMIHREEPASEQYNDLESSLLTEEFTAGELTPSPKTDSGSTGAAEELKVPFADQETLPVPPEIPEVAETTPLPEVPDIPPPAVKPFDAVVPTHPNPRPAPGITSTRQTRSSMPTSATGGSPKASADARGKSGTGGSNGGNGMSDAARLAGGRMPAPTYPAEARAKGQTGTVLVEFVVGENGSVDSAYAKKPSPWPLLNDRAVGCVRSWKFPPGSITRYTRPIVFKLN